MVERLVKSVATGSAPSLRRVGEARAAKMGRRDLADQLADSGRGPLRGGAYAVDRVLDVRKVGTALQVLVRWRGQHGFVAGPFVVQRGHQEGGMGAGEAQVSS